MAKQAAKTTPKPDADSAVVSIEVPLVLGVERGDRYRIDLELTQDETVTFLSVAHALVRCGVRLRDGSLITYDRSFRRNVVRWLLEQIEAENSA